VAVKPGISQPRPFALNICAQLGNSRVRAVLGLSALIRSSDLA
jgi:hypothetical protein